MEQQPESEKPRDIPFAERELEPDFQRSMLHLAQHVRGKLPYNANARARTIIDLYGQVVRRSQRALE